MKTKYVDGPVVVVSAAQLNQKCTEMVWKIQTSSNAKERRQQLNLLMRYLLAWLKYRSHHHKMSKEFWEDLQQEVLLEIVQKIDRFDPKERDFSKLVKQVTNLAFHNLFRKYPVMLSLNTPVNMSGDEGDQMEHLDALAQPTPTWEKWQELYDLLENTPKFKEVSVKGNPSANFYAMVINRLNDVSWQEMAEQWQEKVPTLSSFYRRRLQDFSDHFEGF